MSGSEQGAHSPRFEVTVGGQTYKEASGSIADLVVETTLDGADRFSLTLTIPFDTEQKKFAGFSWDDFSTGKSVDISTGWGDSGEVTPLFVGTIHRVMTNFSDGRGPSVGVSGYGLLHDLMKGTKDRSWSETSVGDVVKEVLSSHFGNMTVDTSGMKRDKIYQHDQSDYRFVQGLADRYGYQFYTKRDEVFFVPRSSMGGEPVATLQYGSTLESFSAELNEADEVQEVEVRHWDMQKEKEIAGKASTDAKNKKKEVFRVPCSSEEEAEQIAQSKLDGLSNAVTAEGETSRGVPEITAGMTVTVTEMGEKFSKDYYVTNATHRVGGSGYKTSFEASEVPE
jgi:phage protein D